MKVAHSSSTLVIEMLILIILAGEKISSIM